MNTRHAFLLKMATTYMFANLDDVCWAFQGNDIHELVEFRGEVHDRPTEDEMREIIRALDNNNNVL